MRTLKIEGLQVFHVSRRPRWKIKVVLDLRINCQIIPNSQAQHSFDQERLYILATSCSVEASLAFSSFVLSNEVSFLVTLWNQRGTTEKFFIDKVFWGNDTVGQRKRKMKEYKRCIISLLSPYIGSWSFCIYIAMLKGQW